MDSALLAEVLLPLAIATIMGSLGLALTPADFRRVLTAPRGVAIGMLNLAVISPLLAFAMAELFDLPPELAVGLVLLGASPGGMSANMLTHLARGDTALSVTMTAISSVASVVTVPLFLGLATGMRLDREGRHDRTDLVTGRALDPLFSATVEAAEEAVLNSMFGAPTTVGRDGNTSESLHSPAVLALLERR